MKAAWKMKKYRDMHDNPEAITTDGKDAASIEVLPGYRVYRMKSKLEADKYSAKVMEDSGASCEVFLSPIEPNVWVCEHFFMPLTYK